MLTTKLKLQGVSLVQLGFELAAALEASKDSSAPVRWTGTTKAWHFTRPPPSSHLGISLKILCSCREPQTLSQTLDLCCFFPKHSAHSTLHFCEGSALQRLLKPLSWLTAPSQRERLKADPPERSIGQASAAGGISSDANLSLQTCLYSSEKTLNLLQTPSESL